jgi:transcriptional regulator with XRE-family HTH domain
MSRKDDVREFLISRRAHITPAQAGLPDYGGERRVPGLHREEVAEVAGVSLDYYTQLERGNLRGASESVLDAIARALQLDDVERAHLFDLAHPGRVGRKQQHATPSVRGSVQRVLDNLAVPAVVFDAAQDLIGSNLMGRALFSPHFESEEPNLVHLPRPPRPGLLRRLAAGTQHDRRDAPTRGRARPAQRRPDRADRRAVDAQPAVPAGLGRP